MIIPTHIFIINNGLENETLFSNKLAGLLKKWFEPLLIFLTLIPLEEMDVTLFDENIQISKIYHRNK